MAFRAGEIFYEILVPWRKPAREAEKGFKTVELMAAKHGKSSGKKFGDEFAFNQRREMLAAGNSGSKAYRQAFKAKQAGHIIMSDMAKGMKTGGAAIGRAAGVAAKGALVVAGIATAIGVVGKAAYESAASMKVLADTAGLSAERYQELAYGARRYKIENEKLSDILKDVNDRVGVMLLDQSGPLQDFLDQVGYKAGLTADSFRDLTSEQVLQLVVKTMEKAGASGAQLTAVMESLASDSTRLIPIFADGGRELNKLAQEARNTGDILSNEAAQGAFDTNAAIERLGVTLRSGLSKAIVEAAPEIEDLTNRIIELTPVLIDWATGAVEGFADIVGAIDTTWNRVNGFARDAQALGIIDAIMGGKLNTMDLGGLRKLADERRQIIFDLQDDLAGNKKRGAPDATIKYLEAQISHHREINRAITERIRIENSFGGDRRMSGVPFIDAGPYTPPSTKRATTKARGSGIRVTPEASTSSTTQLSDDFRASIRETQKELREYARIVEDAMTPMQEYEAAMSIISKGEALGAIDGGSANRARIDTLVELAAATDDYSVASRALGEAIASGAIPIEQAGAAMDGIREELDIVGQAQDKVKERTEAAIETAKEELESRLKVIDAVMAETEAKLELARLPGNPENLAALESELSMLREKRRLIGDGASDADASSGAADRQFDLDAARMEGQARDAFKAGFRSILDGDFEGGLSAMLSRAADSMFDRALDGLLDNLFDGLSGKGGSGGGIGNIFGSIGKLFGFEGGGYTGHGSRSGGMDGKGGFLAMMHPNETVVDHLKPMRGLASLPSMPTLSGAGLPQQSLRLVVEEGPMFRTVVKGEAADVTNTLAPVHAQGAVGQAGRNASRRQSRQL